MYSKYVWPIVLLMVSISACEDPEDLAPQVEIPIKFPNVDPELRPYFQRFEDEAALRGIPVDLTQAGISGVIEEIDEEHIAGQCSFPRNRPNEVTIDRSFWVRGNDFFREFIVFHELGHCYLFRSHLEDLLPSGACISIMRSGNGPCLDNYHSGTRAFYIDELFDGAIGFTASN
ncbi:MAG: hypothetical protein OER04_19555 [Cyclobacteriaceae bacterium]|nr:hypothetical protein [Cyclobacteriaceae bacterium]